LVLDDFLPVEPVLDVRAVDDDARGVPLVVRFHDAGGGRAQREGVCGCAETTAAVGRVRVVQELVLRRAPEYVVVLPGAAVEHAAVAAFADLPLELELEVAEGIAGDEVLDLAVLRDLV